MDDRQLVIIGNGVAGITAARHLRKRSKVRIKVISSESKHFFSRTALMYVYMGHMKYEHIKPYEDHFWEKNRIELLHDRVEKIDFNSKTLQLQKGESLSYDQLIIASGSKTATHGWSGLELQGVQGMYSLQDLQSMEDSTRNCKNAVVIGGGLIGVEVAEMLVSRGIKVDYLVRESRFWGNVLPKEEADLVKQQIEAEGVNIHFNTEVDSFFGNDSEVLSGVKSKDGRTFDCQFAAVATGVKPNVDFLKDSALEIEKGILVNEHLETNLKDVYAIGDCAQLRNPLKDRRSIEAVWYVGKMMGEVVAANICGKPTKYQPSHWFNSAKFFNLEYQTYGVVDASGKDSICWVNDKKNQLIRLAFDPESNKIRGVNSLGVRLSHQQFDQWLNSELTIDQVINDLEKADFNPEFFNLPFSIIKEELRSQLKPISA